MNAAAEPRARTADALAGLAVATGAVIAYAAALGGAFVFDDIHSVASNPGVQTLANLPRFFVDPTLFSGTGNVMYRPVLLCTFALDHALGGGAVLPFKATNVLLHAITAWLLFRLLAGHGAGRPAATVGALLFALHPLASEAVNLVSGRSELLCVLGLLLALRGQLAWRQGGGHGALAGVAAVGGGALLACGSKETGALLPALLLGQELLLAGLPRTRAAALAVLRRLLPALVVVVGYLLARVLLLGQATATLVGRDGSDPMYGHTRDLATQLATMAALLPRALVQVVWPTGLSLDPAVVYHRSLLEWPALLGALALFAWTALGLRHGRQRPLWALGTAFAWATALPWVVVPLNLPLAEHRLYGPLAGLACVATAALDRLVLPRLPSHRGRLLAAVPIVALALLSARRSLDYRDECELWRGAIAQHPASFRAHWGLGTALQRRGEFAAAEPELAQAVALYPAFRTARRSWVECLLQLPPAEGWPYRALVAVLPLTAQKGDDPYYRILHANALLQVGVAGGRAQDIEAAEAMALSCLQIAPPKALVYRLAASCRRALHDDQGALAHFDAALLQGLDFPSLRAERSEALRAVGRAAEADRELRAAFARAPMEATVRAAFARRYAAAPPR